MNYLQLKTRKASRDTKNSDRTHFVIRLFHFVVRHFDFVVRHCQHDVRQSGKHTCLFLKTSVIAHKTSVSYNMSDVLWAKSPESTITDVISAMRPV
jgi:hypothetical protein